MKLTKATGAETANFCTTCWRLQQAALVARGSQSWDTKRYLWTVDTVDWKRPAPTVIVDRVLSQICSGALVLMASYTANRQKRYPIVIDPPY